MKTAVIALLAAPALASFNLLSLPGGRNNLPDIPAGTPENPACIAAINATIDCDPGLITGDFGDVGNSSATGNGELRKPAESKLDGTCTDTCLNSLRKWIRGGNGCEGETFLKYFDLLNATYFGMEMSVADVQQYYITASYWSKCLTDLNPEPNQSKYCILKDKAARSYGITTVGYLNVTSPDTLCKQNSCATQFAYLSAPQKTIYKYDERNATNSDSRDGELPTLTLEQACPGIDTSKYPTREENVAAGATSGNGSGGSGGKANAGARVAVQGSTAFAVVIAMAAYLA